MIITLGARAELEYRANVKIHFHEALVFCSIVDYRPQIEPSS